MMLGSLMDGRSSLVSARASECAVSSHGCASPGRGRSAHQRGFVRLQIICAVCDYCDCSFLLGIYLSSFSRSALLSFCGYHTKSSNQLLEPTAGRCEVHL